MIKFLKQHALLSLAFAAALLFTLMFLVRFTVSTLAWSDPDQLEQPIAGWMTPRYVSRSWQVPPEVVSSALGLEMDGTGRRLTLEEISIAQGRDLDALVVELEAAILAARERSDE